MVVFCSRLPEPVVALVTTDAVSSVQDHHRRHQRQQPPQQLPDADDASDAASSVDDAASELSDEEAASVIEVEVGKTDDRWSEDNDERQPTGKTASSLLSGNRTPTIDDPASRRRAEYIQTAPWRCLPIRHRASVGSYSDPDLASSSAIFSDSERQRLDRARQRRHLARSIDMSQTQTTLNRSSWSSTSDVAVHAQSPDVATRLPPMTNNDDSKQRRNHGDFDVSRSNYVPQKPPPPLPLPHNELVKKLRPVPGNNDATTKNTSSPAASSESSSSTRKQQRPVRELVAQLSDQAPSRATTTTTQMTPPQQQQHQQQQQQRRQQRRQQLQQLYAHGRPLSSSLSDAEADYEIFINTPPAAATATDGDNGDNSVNCLFYLLTYLLTYINTRAPTHDLCAGMGSSRTVLVLEDRILWLWP